MTFVFVFIPKEEDESETLMLKLSHFKHERGLKIGTILVVLCIRMGKSENMKHKQKYLYSYRLTFLLQMLSQVKQTLSFPDNHQPAQPLQTHTHHQKARNSTHPQQKRTHRHLKFDNAPHYRQSFFNLL